jgi:LysR family transcriptional regulator, transcriptional activator of nhaA
MKWLNYHHLLYFWTAARLGSITAACSELHLAQPTVSAQIHALEDSLGGRLFARSGRNLVLTDLGRTVYRYADEIFGLGRQLLDAVHGRGDAQALPLNVGVADVVPKAIAYLILSPALALPQQVRIVCREDKPDRLLAELAVQSLDLVLLDTPMPPTVRARAFSHVLGECGVTWFGAAALAAAYRDHFPSSLSDAPLLLPTDNTALRRSLDEWFERIGVRPRIVSEFEDSALLQAFGERGLGLFPAPNAIADEIRDKHRVEAVGVAQGVRERFYAISPERRLRHPAVVAISNAARNELFG